jgi:hypothetical protein
MLPPERKSLAEYLQHPVRHDSKCNALLGVGWMGLGWMGLGWMGLGWMGPGETRLQEKAEVY